MGCLKQSFSIRGTICNILLSVVRKMCFNKEYFCNTEWLMSSWWSGSIYEIMQMQFEFEFLFIQLYFAPSDGIRIGNFWQLQGMVLHERVSATQKVFCVAPLVLRMYIMLMFSLRFILPHPRDHGILPW